MTIKEELDTELRDAMKSGDTRRRDVIRQIKTEIATATTQPTMTGRLTMPYISARSRHT